MIYNHITEMIGNTPLLLIPEKVHCISGLTLYAKLEYQNPFGSLKDRFARESIKGSLDQLKKHPESKILESSSGNTIKALAGIANTFGISTKTITNRIKVAEQKDILTFLGVEIEQLPSDGECIDLTQQNNAVERIEEACRENIHFFHTDQYRNNLNTHVHQETTGPEIYHDIPTIDYFFSALGTTGSSGGITRYLKSKNKDIHSVGIIADDNDFIPGIRNSKEMDEVGIFDHSLYNTIIEINAQDALEASLRLIKKVGMLCGPTTGAVYEGIIRHFAQHPLGEGVKKTAVFIACDRVEPYLSYIKQRLPHIFHQEHKHCILKITHEDQAYYAKDIDCSVLHEMREKNDPHLLLIDTRHNKSYLLGHLGGSINIELDLLTELTDKGKIFDMNKKIILLCPFGKQTKKLCAYLNMQGFEAYSLTGGIKAWKEKGYSFVV